MMIKRTREGDFTGGRFTLEVNVSGDSFNNDILQCVADGILVHGFSLCTDKLKPRLVDMTQSGRVRAEGFYELTSNASIDDTTLHLHLAITTTHKLKPSDVKSIVSAHVFGGAFERFADVMSELFSEGSLFIFGEESPSSQLVGV